jgi:predicted secreted Zn-dependent protease
MEIITLLLCGCDFTFCAVYGAVRSGNVSFWMHVRVCVVLEQSVKVKVKVTLEQATKAQRGSRGIAVLFLQPRR